MSDSDQLKRNIVDKIKNIQPNIPIKNIIFRKTNLKIPHTKEVIVILKITTSKDRPHQYKNIFYKRLSDGNEPMNASEVKHIILEAQKNKNLLTLLLQECGLIQDVLKEAQKDLIKNKLELSLKELKTLDFDVCQHFMLNQSHFYSQDIAQTLMRIVEILKKFSACIENYEAIQESSPERTKIGEEQLGSVVKKLIELDLKDLSILEKTIGLKFIPSHKKEGISFNWN